MVAAPTPIAMRTEFPETIVAILRSAHSETPDPRLDGAVAAIRRDWVAIARRRYPFLEDVDDAIQNALMKLLTQDSLAGLRDPALVQVWARSVFVRSVLDLIRAGRRTRDRRAVLDTVERDSEDILRDALPSPVSSPEDAASQRERLRIVQRCMGDLEIPKLKFIDGLSDDEIAARCQLTPDAVRSWLKRFRRVVREKVEDVVPQRPARGRLSNRELEPPPKGTNR